MTQPMKTCGNKICREKEKPATNDYFYHDAKSADKLSSWCIVCQKERTAKKATASGTLDRREFMEDALGRLVHVDQVKEIDKSRDGLVKHLVDNARAIQKTMAEFKAMAMSEIDAFVELSAMEYDEKIGGRKGNLNLLTFDGKFKAQVQISEYLVFDERLQVAKTLIDKCLINWTEGSRSEVKTIINDAFSVNQEGKINVRRILSLRRLKISDPLWEKAMQAISDSLQVSGSKSYMRLYERIGQEDRWRNITLDFAAL